MEAFSGSSHSRVTTPSPPFAARPCGAAGRVDAVSSFDAAPGPAGFTARTWKPYVAPLSSPATTKVVVAAPDPGMSCQSSS